LVGKKKEIITIIRVAIKTTWSVEGETNRGLIYQRGLRGGGLHAAEHRSVVVKKGKRKNFEKKK